MSEQNPNFNNTNLSNTNFYNTNFNDPNIPLPFEDANATSSSSLFQPDHPQSIDPNAVFGESVTNNPAIMNPTSQEFNGVEHYGFAMNELMFDNSAMFSSQHDAKMAQGLNNTQQQNINNNNNNSFFASSASNRNMMMNFDSTNPINNNNDPMTDCVPPFDASTSSTSSFQQQDYSQFNNIQQNIKNNNSLFASPSSNGNIMINFDSSNPINNNNGLMNFVPPFDARTSSTPSFQGQDYSQFFNNFNTSFDDDDDPMLDLDEESRIQLQEILLNSNAKPSNGGTSSKQPALPQDDQQQFLTNNEANAPYMSSSTPSIPQDPQQINPQKNKGKEIMIDDTPFYQKDNQLQRSNQGKLLADAMVRSVPKPTVPKPPIAPPSSLKGKEILRAVKKRKPPAQLPAGSASLPSKPAESPREEYIISQEPEPIVVIVTEGSFMATAIKLTTHENYVEQNLRDAENKVDSKKGKQKKGKKVAGPSGLATSVGLESEARDVMDDLVPPLPSTFGLALQPQLLDDFMASQSVMPSRLPTYGGESSSSRNKAGSSGSATLFGHESVAPALMDIPVPALPSTFGLPLQQQLDDFIASQSVMPSRLPTYGGESSSSRNEAGPSTRPVGNDQSGGMDTGVPGVMPNVGLPQQQQFAGVASQSIMPSRQSYGLTYGGESSSSRDEAGPSTIPVGSPDMMPNVGLAQQQQFAGAASVSIMPSRQPYGLTYGVESSSSRNEAGLSGSAGLVGDGSMRMPTTMPHVGHLEQQQQQFADFFASRSIMPSGFNTYGLYYGDESLLSNNNEAGPSRIRNEQEVIEIPDDQPNNGNNEAAGPSGSARGAVGDDMTTLGQAMPSEQPRLHRPEQQ